MLITNKINMAAINSINSGVYYTLAGGKFVRRVKEAQEDSVSRTLAKGKNAGKVVHEISVTGIEGIISSIVFESDAAFGDNTKITLHDGDVLTIKTDGNAGLGFLKMYPNLDLSLPVRFGASQTEAEINGEKVLINNLFMSQNGNPIKWKYTKDNLNGLPPTKKVKVNGKEVTDKTDMLEFLKANVTARANTPDTVVPVFADINEVPF
jgi:hypothetical protein